MSRAVPTGLPARLYMRVLADKKPGAGIRCAPADKKKKKNLTPRSVWLTGLPSEPAEA